MTAGQKWEACFCLALSEIMEQLFKKLILSGNVATIIIVNYCARWMNTWRV